MATRRLLADRRRDFSETRRQGELRAGYTLRSERADRPQRLHGGHPGDDRHDGAARGHGQTQHCDADRLSDLFLVYNTKDAGLELALCRAYNRFLAKACAEAPERVKWVVCCGSSRSTNRSMRSVSPKRMGPWACFSGASKANTWTIHFVPGLRGSAKTKSLHLRAYRLRRQTGSQNVRARP